jgi:hypothetical protein
MKTGIFEGAGSDARRRPSQIGTPPVIAMLSAGLIWWYVKPSSMDGRFPNEQPVL